MNEPVYKNKPIASVSALLKACGLSHMSESRLVSIADRADQYYRPRPRLKPDGSERKTYKPLQPLRTIQDGILNCILSEVQYPTYLFSVRDTKNVRDYSTNAGLHAQNRVLIHLDIKDFFDTVEYSRIVRVWQYFFRFPADIAHILAKLTTYKGHLPQGSPTSTYLANLIFWDTEPAMHDSLAELGFTYTRYVDDIGISTDAYLKDIDLTHLIGSIYGMMLSAGVHPNRAKMEISSRGHLKVLHNLNLNSGRPTLAKKDRDRIKAAVKKCEEQALHDRKSDEYEKLYRSISGRVAMMRRFHPQAAQRLSDRLKTIEPQDA